MRPRTMRCSCSSPRAFSGFSRSEDASNTLQREVNAISSANITTTRPKRRTIGWFIGVFSFELAQFEALYQRCAVRLGAQRVVEQPLPARRCQRRGADARDEVAGVERQAPRQAERDAAVQRDEPAVVGPDEVDRAQRDEASQSDQAEDDEHGHERSRAPRSYARAPLARPLALGKAR